MTHRPGERRRSHRWGELLARKMLKRFPDLRRWERTDDLLQNAMVRLHRILAEVALQCVRHFFNLATVQIRREMSA